MASLEHLDLLIGESLEYLVKASAEIKNIEPADLNEQRQFLMKIGKAISEIWSFREELYKVKPNLKRDFVKEQEQDEKRFENLNELHQKAYKMEAEGNNSSAKKLYEELYSASGFGYFRLIAEAGLYRVSNPKQ